MGEDADVDVVGAADEAIERRAAKPLPPAFLAAVSDEDLGDAVLAREFEDGFDGILAIQNFQASTGGARECEVAIESGLIFGREVGLADVGDGKIAMEA